MVSLPSSDLDRLGLTLARHFGDRLQKDHPLGALTTCRVGGQASLLLDVLDEADLHVVRDTCRDHDVDILVLGKGSNLLVADTGFEGLVLRLGGEWNRIDLPDGTAGRGTGGDQSPAVRAGGAVGLPILARRTVEAGWQGMAWAVGVPGSVGGAVRMNAGGHGSDIQGCLLRCRIFDLRDDGGGDRSAAQLGLGYRTSLVRASDVVMWAEFAVSPGDVGEGKETLSEIVRWRREHQPGGSNAGSVFINPPGDSAGRLIDTAGLKGFRIGSARVSEKHANFIQVDDGGAAEDVRHLIDHVQGVVASQTGVLLRPEIRLVGFPKDDNGSDDSSAPDGSGHRPEKPGRAGAPVKGAPG